MAANCLSPHPSNPLEVQSSDLANRHHRDNVLNPNLSSYCGEYDDSDDPLAEIPQMEARAYQDHIAEIRPDCAAATPKPGEDVKYVDLDEGMSSEEEESDDLQVLGQDDTPRKAASTKGRDGADCRRLLFEQRMRDEEEDAMDEEVGNVFDEEEEDLRLSRRASRSMLVEEEVIELPDEDEEMVDDWAGVDLDDDENHSQQDYEDSNSDLDNGIHPTSTDADCFALDESAELSTLRSKPLQDQTEIQAEIEDFKDSLPQLSDYKLIDRLGTGTFSSVYKALDLHYHEYDNAPWLGPHPPESSAHYQSLPKPKGARVFVAIKRIYVTSGPERIKNELQLMENCRGCRHVSQLITAFRHDDQVAIVMPYHRNEDFREYFQDLPMPAMKEYMRCLLRALRDVHDRFIIHRDVKPANFLFDPRTGQGSLCDFGLAQRFDKKPPTSGACLHSTMAPGAPHGKYLHKSEYSTEMVTGGQAKARAMSKKRADLVGYPDKDTRVPMKANRAGTRGFRAPEVLLKCGQQNGAVDVWSAGIILLFFLSGKFPLFQANDDIEALMEIATILGRTKMEKVATLHCRTFATNVPDAQKDQVPWRTFVLKLNPALLSVPAPNPKFYPYTLPSYKAQIVLQAEAENSLGGVGWGGDDDDTTISDKNIGEETPPRKPASDARSSPLSSPPPSPEIPIAGTKPKALAPLPPKPLSPTAPTPLNLIDPPTAEKTHLKDVSDALDLLERLLHPESVKRITPRDALYHPFLAERGGAGRVGLFGRGGKGKGREEEEGVMGGEVSSSTVVGEESADLTKDPKASKSESNSTPRTTISSSKTKPTKPPKGDDNFAPHPFGQGVCAEFHFIDDVTSQPGVIVRQAKCLCGCGRCGAPGRGGNGGEGEGGEGCEGGDEQEDVKKLVLPGEGIAVGEMACEFHRGYREGW